MLQNLINSKLKPELDLISALKSLNAKTYGVLADSVYI